MFEQLRADCRSGLAEVEAALAAAAQRTRALRDQLAVLQRALVDEQSRFVLAEQSEQQSVAALRAAESRVAQTASAVTAAETKRAEAYETLSLVRDSEPEDLLPNGKPNPAHAKWNIRLNAAVAALEAAEAGLAETNAVLQQAQQTSAAAAAQVSSAEQAVASARASVATRTADVGACEQAVAAAGADEANHQGEIEAVQRALAALDARAARLLVEPLRRDELQPAADAELAALAQARQQRYAMLSARSALAVERAALLSAHDQALVGLFAIQTEMAAWSAAGRFPELAVALEKLTAIARTAQLEQRRPIRERTDDLGAVEASVREARALLAAAVAQAQRERERATEAVLAAANALSEHQQEQL